MLVDMYGVCFKMNVKETDKENKHSDKCALRVFKFEETAVVWKSFHCETLREFLRR